MPFSDTIVTGTLASQLPQYTSTPQSLMVTGTTFPFVQDKFGSPTLKLLNAPQMGQMLGTQLQPSGTYHTILSFGDYTVQPLSATSPVQVSPSPGSFFILEWDISWFVFTNNSGSNNWKIDLLTLSPGTIVSTFSTSGSAAGQWTRQVVSSVSGTFINAATDMGLYTGATKNNSAGNLYAFSVLKIKMA